MSVVIETTVGDLTVDLYTDDRPIACLNFLKLCKLKYYNYNLFHKVEEGFIAQTGDPSGTGDGGSSIWGVIESTQKRFFEAEYLPKINHNEAGLLSLVSPGNHMVGSQFFLTLAPDLRSLDGIHCVIGEVVEGHDVLRLLNEALVDEKHRPYQDIRITHMVVLNDPFPDPRGFQVPSRSPSPSAERLQNGRIAADEDIDDTEGKTMEEIQEMLEEREAKARATILEIVGDIPDADVAPPENVLFVCKLNPVTAEDDLEIIFSRFGKVKSCEVIRDRKSGDSLQYAFVEFEDEKSCETAYFKMDNVLIDDRRIHVDFSQSVAKVKWKGKGRGVEGEIGRLDFSKLGEEPKRQIRNNEGKEKRYDSERTQNGSNKIQARNRMTSEERRKAREERHREAEQRERNKSRSSSRNGSRNYPPRDERHREHNKSQSSSRNGSRNYRSREEKHREAEQRDRNKSRPTSRNSSRNYHSHAESQRRTEQGERKKSRSSSKNASKTYRSRSQSKEKPRNYRADERKNYDYYQREKNRSPLERGSTTDDRDRDYSYHKRGEPSANRKKDKDNSKIYNSPKRESQLSTSKDKENYKSRHAEKVDEGDIHDRSPERRKECESSRSHDPSSKMERGDRENKGYERRNRSPAAMKEKDDRAVAKRACTPKLKDIKIKKRPRNSSESEDSGERCRTPARMKEKEDRSAAKRSYSPKRKETKTKKRPKNSSESEDSSERDCRTPPPIKEKEDRSAAKRACSPKRKENKTKKRSKKASISGRSSESQDSSEDSTSESSSSEEERRKKNKKKQKKKKKSKNKRKKNKK